MNKLVINLFIKMSKPASRPNSQQKKTGITIISDPIQFKKPTINDMRSDNNGANNVAFKKPTISDLRSNASEDASSFKPPSVSAMRNSPAPSQDLYQKPSISDLRNASNANSSQQQNNHDQGSGFKRPTMSDMQNIQVELKIDPTKEDPHYKPYTVEEYRELQQMDEISGSNRGGLGPSFDDEWEKKREMRTRLMQFAQKTKEENKNVIPKRSKPRQNKPKGPSKHDKMKEYATKIPKPKAQTPTKGNDKIEPKKPKQKPAAAKYDINAELQRHAHFVQRVGMLRASVAKYLD